MAEQEKTILVTGAAGGLGRAVVQKLVGRGANVIALDVDPDTGSTIAAIEGIDENRVMAIVAKVSAEDDVAAALEAGVARWGRLDGVVNTAAVLGTPNSFLQVPVGELEEVLKVNVIGAWLVMRCAIPHLLAVGGGAIVNIGSYNSIRGGSQIAAYTASKHALVGLTKSVAIEFAKQGVTANVLSPGSMEAPMQEPMLALHGGGDKSAGAELSKSRIPQGRFADPAELAEVVSWLTIDAPPHLTGQVICVDGGRSAV